MKKKLFTILILLVFKIYAQDISAINSDLNLSDSLINETEIRVYESYGTSNYTSLFRMYKDSSEKWKIKFYEHYAEVIGASKLRTEENDLKTDKDIEFIYHNLLRSYILDLHSQETIQWKLKKRGKVEKVRNTFRGKTIEEYTLISRKTSIVDGNFYTVKVKTPYKTNNFTFSNPESYLKIYPEIDELIYMSEILSIIKNEFGIWEK